MKKNSTLIAFLFLVIAGNAQTPQLLKDVNPNTVDVLSSSFPQKGVVVNGKYYFPAANFNGTELWKTDGTAPGTGIVKDVSSVAPYDNTDPRLITVFGDTIFFFGRQGINIFRYKTADDQLYHVINYNNAVSPTEAIRAGQYIFFQGDADFSQGIELLRYNVNNDQLTIFEINSGPGDSNPHNLIAKGDSVFFAATDPFNGTELWMYDPGIEDIIMLGDIRAGADSSNPSDFVIYNNKLFFSADDGINGNELWSSNGDPIGTVMFANINEYNSDLDPSNPDHKTVFNGKLYFSATDGNDGIELWEADDNTSSFSQVLNINLFGDSNPGIYGFKQAGAFLYFAADDGNDGIELWSTDGTTTDLVENINPFGDSHPMQMYNLNDTLIFVANDGVSDLEIWRSKGTAATTELVQNIQPPGADTLRISGVYNGNIYFGADNGNIGQELWKTNGLSVNTSLVKDLNFGNDVHGIYGGWFEPFNGQMYFGAQTGPGFQFGLHKTDGTTGGTVVVKPGGGPDNYSTGYDHGRKAGANLFFGAYTVNEGNELWKTDGTLGNTVMVKDINPGTGSTSIWYSIEMGSLLIFSADNGTDGTELWKSDGTTLGTIQLKNINPAPGISSDVRELRLVNGKVCFIANDGTTGDELWVTDGTPGGTVILKDINNNAAGSNISNLYVVGTRLYFTANDGTTGNEVWMTDGTPGGTTIFKDINLGPGSSDPGNYTQLGGYVYFGAKDADNNPQKLWRTDGTAINTSQFFDVNFPFFLTNIGSRIVFWCFPSGSTNGFHLWSTNGTGAGTMEIADFLPGEMGYLILDDFPVYNGKWFLWLDNRISGQELWATNGTTAGTIMYDIAPGPESSYPRGARGLNPLIFAANDGTAIGNEVWKLDVSITLPVTGLEFNVSKQTNKALLEWNTFSEDNNSGFEIQKSSDGVRFAPIGFAASRGAGGGGASYNFTDANVLAGKNYYRLKQTDHDGRISYSQVRWVDFSKEGYVKAYPNPTQDILYINTGYTFRDATMNIRSMNGQLTKQIKVNGTGTIAIPVKDLPAGIYNVEVLQPGQTVKLIFIKQ